MRRALRPFANRSTMVGEKISYQLWREKARIGVEYEVCGQLDHLVIPKKTEGIGIKRRDELWKHTCFEIFVKASAAYEEEYVECNFSPSGDWNVYSFTGYRTTMEEAALAREPEITVSSSDKIFRLRAEVELPVDIIPEGEIVAGVCCVTVDREGNVAYWALSHPRDKPDFHDPRSFLRIL